MNSETQGQFYRGRFAPSPSGPLHFGSLTSALASYLDAKTNQGEWLVRIEDIDPPREIAGSDKLILQSLEAHGLEWDGDILYQSSRSEAYQAAIAELSEQDLIFYCSCTHKQLKEFHKNKPANAGLMTHGIYPGFCRHFSEYRPKTAIRLKVNAQTFLFHDAVYGLVAQDLESEVGDFVLKRRDNLYAYQLAVVVDDIHQGITHIVRGVDLLDSTPRQLFLYQLFNAQTPNYTHLPLALLANGKKLSKQTGAKSLANKNAQENLFLALKFLGQQPPSTLQFSTVNEIIHWGIQHWSISKIKPQDTVI